jgi:hypothetical protein
MSSQARIDASRANGKLSQGPITEAGKAISSQNALRHGLTASTILIDGELPGRFEALLGSLVAEHQPETETERQLVETMAVCKWRQLRIWSLENGGHSEEIRRLTATSEEMAAKGNAERAWYAFCEISRSKAMATMSRLELRFDRMYNHAHRLMELREKKQ